MPGRFSPEERLLDRETVRKIQWCLNIINGDLHPDLKPLELNGILGKETRVRLITYLKENENGSNTSLSMRGAAAKVALDEIVDKNSGAIDLMKAQYHAEKAMAGMGTEKIIDDGKAHTPEMQANLAGLLESGLISKA